MNQRMTLIISIVALVLSVAAMVGCAYKKVNSNNPAVIAAVSVNSAAHMADALSNALAGARTYVESVKTTEPDYYANFDPWITKVAKLNDAAIAALKAAKAGDTSGSWIPALQAVAAEAGKMNPTVWGFKNPTSQTGAIAAFAAFEAALSTIASHFGGKQ